MRLMTAQKVPDPAKVMRVITRLNIGGPSLHAACLSTGLDPQRFSTCLVVGEPGATEGNLLDLVQGSTARVLRLRTLTRPIRPWADLWTLARLLRIVWQERPAIIHTHMAKAGALGRAAGFLYNGVGPGRRAGQRAALLHTFHGHVLEGYFPRWIAGVFLAIERWLARQTDILIAVSPAVRDDLLKRGIGRPSQWRVIPLGLRLTALSRLAPPDGAGAPLRVGTVGRLVPIKNAGMFLQALARLGVQTPVRGLVVGDGPLRSALEREARTLGVERVVHFAGWQHDVRAVYERLDVACVTSWNEGTPVSLLEAMAAGRAVVATDVGGIRDLLAGAAASDSRTIARGTFQIAPRGVLVRPGDPEGLAAALRRLAADAALRRSLGEAGRRFVTEHFTEERLVRDIERLYDELAGPGGRGPKAEGARCGR